MDRCDKAGQPQKHCITDETMLSVEAHRPEINCIAADTVLSVDNCPTGATLLSTGLAAGSCANLRT
jgi:hypothetical protein